MRLVLLAGLTSVLTAALPAQWQLVLGTPAGLLGPCVYDASRQAVVMCGAGGTHAWTGASWTQITATSPIVTFPPSPANLLAYDEARAVIVYYNPGLQQTWELQGTTWTQIATAHAPPVRGSTAMVYHAVAAACVLHGGFSNGTLWDTWHYDGVDWVQRATSSARDSYAFYYDPHRGEAVAVFGIAGVAQFPVNIIETYDGANPAGLLTSNGMVLVLGQ